MNSILKPRIGEESSPRSTLPNPNEMNSSHNFRGKRVDYSMHRRGIKPKPALASLK
jgi:hypothetical protein